MAIVTATVTVSKDALESAPHRNILFFVDNRTYIKDPRHKDSTEILRQFVYDSDPFHKGISFKDMPYIVLNFPTLEYSRISLDGKVKYLTWQQRIIVRAGRDGAVNSRTGTGRDNILAIGDDLQETFNSETVKQLLRDVRLFNMNLIKVNVATGIVSSEDIYESEYRLTYNERITVTA